MEPTRHLVVVRGGGDIATGVVWRLARAGFPVVVLELPVPLTVRRTVAVSTAVLEGSITIESLDAKLASDAGEARRIAHTSARNPRSQTANSQNTVVPVLVSPHLAPVAAELSLPEERPAIVVDARLAKRNIDTAIDDGAYVIGLGPGFTVGIDVHAVIETNRGHHLGRMLSDHGQSAEANTATPGSIDGYSTERVLRSPIDGQVEWHAQIGDVVHLGQLLGVIKPTDPSGEPQPVCAAFDGLVRGLISPRVLLRSGTKIGDIDPRIAPAACAEISDKALAIGGGVLEAALLHLRAADRL